LRPDETDAMVRAYTSTRTTAEIVDAAAALRIPVAPVGDGHNVVGHPQFK
jgi:crotonobetainyl-CoA:carnitine CoA-transferase CaiB-like acyl-CoA transferase